MSANLIPYLYQLHKLIKDQRLSPPKLEELQVKKLKALLHHAYHKVDYYKRLFDQASFSLDDINTLHDIVKIPITTRRKIQSLSKEEIIAKYVNPAYCLNLRTSGSTGMPLDIFVSAKEIMSRWLFYRRMYFENSGKLQDRALIITSPQNFRNRTQWFNKLGILKEKYISIFDDTESQLEAILELRPQIIRSYASALKNLAIEIQDHKIKGISPRIVFSTAELLTRKDREFIASVFKSNVFDYYACLESGIIAWECKQHSGYHINSDNVIVEFIKEDGTPAQAGEEAEVVITSLNSYTMPFIRYKLDDIGVLSDERCPCGITLPLMKIIAGRTNDCIILPSGRRISPFFLTGLLRDISGINQFQIVQQRIDKIKLNIVKNHRFSIETISKLRENCNNILKANIEIEINIVEKIDNNNSGKFQVVRSEI